MAGQPASNASAATASTRAFSATRATPPVSATLSANLPAGSVTPGITEGKPGPWGQMQYVPIVLEIPDEYLFVNQAAQKTDTWTFTGKSRDAAMAFLRSCGFDETQLSSIARCEWSDFAGSSSVQPSDEVILSLSSEVRAALYNALALEKANATSIDPYWYRPGKVDFRLRGSDLAPESLSLFKNLLYPSRDGTALLFTDVGPALRAIADPAEQKKFAKAISRKRSLMARLSIHADSDIEAIAAYWGVDGRQKDLVPFLNSLKYNVEAGVEEPSRMNIVTLLPSFARERLYNHAYATQTSVTSHQEDCFWTAFNFFSSYPDNQVNDMKYLQRVLERDYYKISEPTKLGDLILITDDTGDAVHAANYIADDIVFTKNGVNFTQPWILLPMQDMLETYRIKTKKTQVVYFRRK